MRWSRMQAALLLDCGFEVDPEVVQMANKKDCVIITTPYDTFSIARLINQSMPIKEFMTREHLVTFDIDDYVDDIKETMSKIRHRDFPILDENGNYLGMVSRRNLMSMQKKQIILVDHNEKSQAVDNINEAEILEIIDHHRTRKLRDDLSGLFQKSAVGMYVHDHLSDVRREKYRDPAAYCRIVIVSDSVRHVNVPFSDLHTA